MENVIPRRSSSFLFLSFSCILVSCSLFFGFSTAIDTITPSQSISDGESLVSPAQKFELGFFSPGNSSNRYLGIWYKNISPKTVVWVANRDNPLTDSSGILKIVDYGNLVLVNKTGVLFWSSISSRSAENRVAQLLDSGNLVLREEEDGSNYLWQSFDYPSDTLLPGMKFGRNLKTGINRNLTSWKNEDDPFHGEYSVNMDILGSPQIVLRKNGVIKKYRMVLWNGIKFVKFSTKIYRPSFVSNSEEVYFMYEVTDLTSITRSVINHLGFMLAFSWNNQTQQWTMMYAVPTDDCDRYGQCGANSICKVDNMPICYCLKGFKPKRPSEWDVLNWTNGCVRESPLGCGKGDGFVKLTRMKVPDLLKFWLNREMSLKECKVECLRNCSCVAYTNSNSSNPGSGCLIFFGDLIDVREFNGDRGEQDLYIRVPASELESTSDGSNKKQVLLKEVLPVVSVMILGGIILFVIWKMKTRKRASESHSHKTIKNGEDGLELPLFDSMTIEAATENFSNANKIGEGGFGPVYKGTLPTGQEIAVKRLSHSSKQGLKEFKNEVILIAKLQHRNLVRLLGCCVEKDEMMLIYEYMPNKSLNSFIFDQTICPPIRWKKRFDIIVGIARGLLYLHRDSRLKIIHRDLKASNVLLDNEMNPKISDFGLAKTFGEDQIEAKTRRVIGTYGYMSPEYAVDGLFSMKSDVFSFGVLVLEIVSGKRNRGFLHPDHDLSLLGHAWNLWNEGKALDLMDTMMKEDIFFEYEVLRCIQVGLLCVQQRREDRPTMSLVLLMLDTENMVLPQPKQPGFYTERYPIEIKSSSCSENVVSITLPQGR